MITKEEFSKYILEFQNFDKAIIRMSQAIAGTKWGIPLFESDWFESVTNMLDIFLDTHFTESGVDWINYFLWENIDDKLVTITKPKDIFNEEEKLEYHLNSIDELWDFLLTDVNMYFKNV